MKTNMKILEMCKTPAQLAKWLGVIAVIKLALFGWLTLQLKQNWDPNMHSDGIVFYSADTPSYLDPAQEFAEGKGYHTLCRMPGIVPVYSLFSAIGGPALGRIAWILAQLITTVLATWYAARIVQLLTQSWLAFRVTALLGALSTFVSVWDHYLLSDSLSVSFMIFSIWSAYRHLETNKRSALILSAAWMTWSVFMRPVMIILFPCLAAIVWFNKKYALKQKIAKILVMAAVPVIVLAAWTAHNIADTGRPIFLTALPGECFNTNTPQLNAVMFLTIAWGEDYQKWSDGSCAMWLLSTERKPIACPIKDRVLTSAYNLDSLAGFKADYKRYVTSADPAEQEYLGAMLVQKADHWREVYRTEHMFDYYFVNRLRLIKLFMFPPRLDNYPGPSFSEMNIVQKVSKAGYFVLLLLVNALALLAVIRIFWKQRNLLILASFALMLILVLSAILGFVEQRYFAPVYAIHVMLIGALLGDLLDKKTITTKN